MRWVPQQQQPAAAHGREDANTARRRKASAARNTEATRAIRAARAVTTAREAAAARVADGESFLIITINAQSNNYIPTYYECFILGTLPS